MVEAGKGEEAGKFVDVNQGITENSFAKARVFLSYFDPDGPAVWTNNAPKINPEVPLLLVVGTRDEYAPRVLYRGLTLFALYGPFRRLLARSNPRTA